MFKIATSLLSSSLAVSVMLLGVHAKDVSALSHASPLQARKLDDSGVGQKIQKLAEKQVGELHNHIEKQTYKSAVKTFSDQSPQADQRSLRKQRHTAPDRRLRFLPWWALIGARA